jgi:hypothetical protein
MIQLDRPQKQYNTAHSLFILSNLGYRQTHRICNTYCFSSATMVSQTRLKVTFLCVRYIVCLVFSRDGTAVLLDVGVIIMIMIMAG